MGWIVAWLQPGGLLELLQGAFQVGGFRQGKSEVDPCFGICRRGLNRGMKEVQRLIFSAPAHEHHAARHHDVYVIRSDCGGPVEQVHRLDQSFRSRQQASKIVHRLHIAWIIDDRFAEQPLRFGRIRFRLHQHAKVVLRLGIGWIKLDGKAQLRFRLSRLGLSHVQKTKLVVYRGIPRIQAQSMLKRTPFLMKCIALVERYCKSVVVPHVVRVGGYGSLKGRGGARSAALQELFSFLARPLCTIRRRLLRGERVGRNDERCEIQAPDEHSSGGRPSKGMTRADKCPALHVFYPLNGCLWPATSRQKTGLPLLYRAASWPSAKLISALPSVSGSCRHDH